MRATVLAAMIVAAAAFSHVALPFRTIPRIDLPTVRVEAWWSGVSAATMERIVTAPIVSELRQVDGAWEVVSRTSSDAGVASSRVEARTSPEREAYVQAQLVARLAALQRRLPEEVDGPILGGDDGGDASATAAVFRMALTGDLPRDELAALASREVLPAIAGLHGVAPPEIEDAREREIVVTLRPAAGEAYGVGAADVIAALRRAALVDPAGHIDDARGRTALRAAGSSSAAAILNGQVGLDAGRGALRVADIARLTVGEASRKARARLNGRDAVIIRVPSRPGADAMALREALEHIARRPWRSGAVALVLLDDQTAPLLKGSRQLDRNLLVAGLAASAVALVASGVWFTFALAIVTVLGWSVAWLLLLLLGLERTLATAPAMLTATVLVVLATAPVLEASRAFARTDALRGRVAPRIACSLWPTKLALLGGIAIALAPLLLASPATRIRFAGIAAEIGVAIVGGTVSVLLFLPLAARLARLAAPPRGVRQPRMTTLREKIVAPIIRRPVSSITVAAALAAALVSLAARGGERASAAAPGFSRTSEVRIRLYARGEVGPDEIDGAAGRLEAVLLASRAVTGVLTEVSDREATISGRLRASSLAEEDRMSLEEAAQSIAATLGDIHASIVIGGRSVDAGPVSGRRFPIRVVGTNLSLVERTAEAVQRQLAAVARVRRIRTTGEDRDNTNERDAPESVEIVLRPRQAAMAEAGMSPAMLAEHVDGVLRRERYFENLEIAGERYAVRLATATTASTSERDLLASRVSTPGGRSFDLQELVDVVDRPGVPAIVREGQQYLRIVSFEIDGPISLGEQLRERVMRRVLLPDGVQVLATTRSDHDEKAPRVGLPAVVLVVSLFALLSAAVLESIAAAACTLVVTVASLAIPPLVSSVADAAWTLSGACALIIGAMCILLMMSGYVDLVGRRGGSPRRRMVASRSLIHSALIAAALMVPVLLGRELGGSLWDGTWVTTLVACMAGCALTSVIGPAAVSLRASRRASKQVDASFPISRA